MGCASRVRKGQKTSGFPNLEINRPTSGSASPDQYDGRKNTNAGDQPGTAGSRGELQVQGPAKVIQTH